MTQVLILGKLDIGPLLKAEGILEQAIRIATSDLEKSGAIQAFEFSYELAWKTMKRILAERGVEVFSPKQTFRAAASEGLIQDPETWFKFLDMRNLTVHTYDQVLANKIFNFLPDFSKELRSFTDKIRSL